MSWSRRSLIFAPLALAACGFTPVYGPGQAGNQLLNSIRVQELKDRDGFLLVQRLEERLGRPAAPLYDLQLAVGTGEAGLAVDPAGDIERFHVVGNAEFHLRGVGGGPVIVSGNVNDFTGYSSSGSTVATLAAQRDARERLMIILADEIIVRLQTADLPT